MFIDRKLAYYKFGETGLLLLFVIIWFLLSIFLNPGWDFERLDFELIIGLWSSFFMIQLSFIAIIEVYNHLLKF